MKKSVKILTLVLSLALICGAVVVAAFAAEPGYTVPTVTGIILDNKADFEGSTAPNPIPTQETNNNSAATTVIDNDGAAKAVQFKHQKGGQPVLVTNPYDNNTYITVDWTQNPNTSSGHFFDTYLGAGSGYKAGQWGVWKDQTDAPIFGTKIMYTILDVDLKWDDPANYDGSGFFYPYLGYTKADGTNFKNLNMSVGLVFPKSGSDVAVAIQGSNEKFVIGSNGAWSHVTFIMGYETNYNENDVCTGVTIHQYLAVDGKIVSTFDYTTDAKESEVYNGDLSRLYTRDVRFDAFGRKTTSGSVDNYTVRSIDTTYTGNIETVLEGGVGADLTTWDGAIYNADYNMPFGTLVATIGEDKYDSLDKAVAAADGSEPIVLKSNVASIVVDKAVTIECGDYTIASLTTEGKFTYTYDEDANTYTIEAAADGVYIEFVGCTCPMCESDENDGHLVYVEEIECFLNNKIASYYEAETGISTNWMATNGATCYTLVGWEDDYGNVYDLDAVVTEWMLEEVWLTLTPVIEVSTADISYVNANGETVYYTGTNALKTALGAAKTGTTITLLNNIKQINAGYAANNNVTLELNGYVINAVGIKDVDQADKSPVLITVATNKTFTILGSKPGSGMVQCFADKVSDGKTGLVSTYIIKPNTGCTINLGGEYLNIASGQFIATWGANNFTVNIDGGYYAKNNMSDGIDFMYFSGVTGIKVNIKNASIGGGISFSKADATNVVTYDNCYIYGASFNNNYESGTVTVTNSIVVPQVKAYKTANNSLITLGAGNILAKAPGAGVKYAAGQVLLSGEFEAKYTYYKQGTVITKDDKGNLVVDPSTFVFTKVDETKTFGYKTTAGVNVTFKDGETTLATVPGPLGAMAVGPAAGTAEPVADGWVMATKAYAYTVPADATADITVDIKDVTEYSYTYAAGAPKVYVNYRLTDNLATNFYIPVELPEGVVLTDTTLNSSHSGRTYTKGVTIGGVAYQYTQGWPMAWGADGDNPVWVLSYEYAGTSMTYTVKVNVVDYAKKVVATYGESDTKKMQQITALLLYVEAANVLKGETPANGLSDYLDTLQAKYTIPSPAGVEGANDITALTEYISGSKVTINSTRGGSIIFNLTEKAQTEGVTIQVVSSLTRDEKNIIVPIAKASDGKSYFLDNAGICDWAGVDLTINVLKGEEVIATGTYSVAAYYNNVVTEETPAAEVDILKAMYALAVIGNVNN